MQRAKIKLITNVPCVLVLENATGKETTSRFHEGVEYMYSVQHQGEPAILFLPVDAHLAIQRSGAGEGDQIEITKTLRSGTPHYAVRVFSDADLAVPTAPPPPPPTREVRMVAPRPVAPPPTRNEAFASQLQQTLAAQPYQSGAAALAAQPAPAQDGENTALAKRCFRAAIDVLLDARTYGASRDLALTFNEEDVRALGISFLIGAQKGGLTSSGSPDRARSALIGAQKGGR